jgi:P-type Cu+ transporter
METVNWKVEGMDCANCALAITKYLEKQGMQQVKVNPVVGDVVFDLVEAGNKESLQKGIERLGYKVVQETAAATTKVQSQSVNKFLRYTLWCLPFTLVLMLHMLDPWVHVHWLMNGWVQFALCLPVFLIGMSYFGKSAWNSIRNGVPNMNVLVAIGATAAFGYSLIGTIAHWGHDFLFYETAATIITLVFLGNYMEEASIHKTQSALQKLAKKQTVMATMIAFDDQHQEQLFPIENIHLKNGDLVLIKSGEQVPTDCKILWGQASVNESIITGESLPVEKKAKDLLVGGSLMADGNVKAIVTAEAKHSVLSNIIDLVKKAQGDKPPVQLMADRISAIFVPAVLIIALLTFIGNYIYLESFTPALMRSIAVLVIACPCAMGLATPAAIAVGLGRAARQGILFRNARSLEQFKDIQQIVFDKTGTLTTGNFSIRGYSILDANISDDVFKRIVYSLEKYSNHPIAQCITRAWKTKDLVRWNKVEEQKGIGMYAVDATGDRWMAGSQKIASTQAGGHNIYITRNEQLIGWIDVEDEIRPEAKEVVAYFQNQGIKTILLSGDRKEHCARLAEHLGIQAYMAEQSPQEKLSTIAALTASKPTAMVGDGINDAPALAKATVGISLSDASQVAMQTADVVLMNNGLAQLPLAIGLGKHTYITIKQNLFWAFIYNLIAIPVAAFGFLNPAIAALTMGLSDVILAINSVRLFIKKVV